MMLIVPSLAVVVVASTLLLLPATNALSFRRIPILRPVKSVQVVRSSPFTIKSFRRHQPSLTTFILSLSSDVSSTDESLPDEEERQRGKSKLIKLYQIMTYLYGSVGLALWAIPDRTLTIRLASKWGGAAGYGLAAGVSHILAQAAMHDRLNSDTYKRLNVGLLAFSTLGLVAVPGEAAFAMEPNTAILIAGMAWMVRLLGIPIAYLGWKRGVVTAPSTAAKFGPNQMIQELVTGTKATLQGLKVQHRKKALTYRNSLLLVALAMFSSFMEGIFGLRVRI